MGIDAYGNEPNSEKYSVVARTAQLAAVTKKNSSNMKLKHISLIMGGVFFFVSLFVIGSATYSEYRSCAPGWPGMCGVGIGLFNIPVVGLFNKFRVGSGPVSLTILVLLSSIFWFCVGFIFCFCVGFFFGGIINFLVGKGNKEGSATSSSEISEIPTDKIRNQARADEQKQLLDRLAVEQRDGLFYYHGKGYHSKGYHSVSDIPFGKK